MTEGAEYYRIIFFVICVIRFDSDANISAMEEEELTDL